MDYIASTLASYAADLGLDAGKQRINNKIDEKKLKESLTAYIERHSKYNEICSSSESIDFQGLIEYIDKFLLNDVITRLYDNDSKKRGIARETIINKAIAYSKANTPESISRVKKPSVDV